MCVIKYIENQHVDLSLLNDIIEIKSVAWPYSYEAQLKWISKHLTDNDLHALLYEEDNLIAYMNLINIDLHFNGVLHKALGIGNVCSKEQGKGYGNLLMLKINTFLENNNKRGVLLCKDSLVNFYKKSNWINYDGKVYIEGALFKNNMMYYNMEIKSNIIQIDKYF